MIEKLKTINPYDETEIDMDTNSVAGLVYENTPLVQKINELVDAVNELQKNYDNVCIWVGEQKLKTPAKNVQDKFAQYRDWAGKLCRFWNIDKDKAIYGILERVNADWAYRFQMKGENYLFDHCEPVKPDDDIIYKGGDNE